MKFLSVSLLMTSVAASPIDSYIKALNNRAISATSADLSNFKLFTQWAASAYCNHDNEPGQAITCSEDECIDLESNGATTVASFNGALTGIAGYVGIDSVQELIAVTIRGSQNIRNWITNLAFALDDCDDLSISNCKIHTGFQTAYNEISMSIQSAVTLALAANPSYQVIVTGHSLGGAVGTIAAAHLRKNGTPCDLYTYGSPRAGNYEFVDFVANQSGSEYRITHTADPVSRLPPLIFGYRHVTPEYWLETGSGTTVDYSVGDIKVCEGTASIWCNAGTFGLDFDAHGHYLQTMGGCSSTEGLPWKRDVSDEELKAMVNQWVAEDIAAVEQGEISLV